jgi:uncharacterized protein (DUF2336 family)
MSDVDRLLAELDQALTRGRDGRRQRLVSELTDLFLTGGAGGSATIAQLYETLTGHLVPTLDLTDRVDLAERLADAPFAPHRIIRTLALDEIQAATPILTRSSVLTDADLVEVAKVKGPAHMLAMTRRSSLSAAVTDVLVRHNNVDVVQALAANPNALLSDYGANTIFLRAHDNDRLMQTLADRADVPERIRDGVSLIHDERERFRRLLTGETAQPRTGPKPMDNVTSLPSPAQDPMLDNPDATRPTSRSEAETLLVKAARDRDGATVHALLALLAGIARPVAERALADRDQQMVVAIARVANIAMSTVVAVMEFMLDTRLSDMSMRKLQGDFDRMTPQIAQRTVRFAHMKGRAATG